MPSTPEVKADSSPGVKNLVKNFEVSLSTRTLSDYKDKGRPIGSPGFSSRRNTFECKQEGITGHADVKSLRSKLKFGHNSPFKKNEPVYENKQKCINKDSDVDKLRLNDVTLAASKNNSSIVKSSHKEIAPDETVTNDNSPVIKENTPKGHSLDSSGSSSQRRKVDCGRKSITEQINVKSLRSQLQLRYDTSFERKEFESEHKKTPNNKYSGIDLSRRQEEAPATPSVITYPKSSPEEITLDKNHLVDIEEVATIQSRGLTSIDSQRIVKPPENAKKSDSELQDSSKKAEANAFDIHTKRRLLIVGLKEHLSGSKVSNGEKSQDTCEQNKNQHEYKLSPTNNSLLNEVAAHDETVTKPSEQLQACTGDKPISKLRTDEENTAVNETDTDENEGDFSIRLNSLIDVPFSSPLTTPDTQSAEPQYLKSIVKHCQGALSVLTPSRRGPVVPDSPNKIETVDGLGATDSLNDSVVKRKCNLCKIVKTSCKQCIETCRNCKLTLHNRLDRINSRKTLAVGQNMTRNSRQIWNKIVEKLHEKGIKIVHWTSQLPTVGMIIFQSSADMKHSTLISLVGLLLSMVGSLYPTSPRFNTELAALTVFFCSSPSQNDQPRSFYILHAVVTFLSVAVDVDWLISDYYPSYPQEIVDELMYRKNQDASLIMRCSRLSTFLALFTKMASVIYLGKGSKAGQDLQISVWKNANAFFPPTSLRPPENIDDAVQKRVIAFFFLELVCSVIILSLALFAQFQLSWSPNFNTPSPFLSLKHAMIVKVCSGIALVLNILVNADPFDLLAEFGCMLPCWEWYSNRTNLLQIKRGFRAPKVLITSSFITCNGFIKIIDLLVGVLLWPSLVSAHRLGGWNKPKEIRLILGLLTILVVLTDILCVMLSISIFWYVKLSNQRRQMDEISESSVEFSTNNEEDKWSGIRSPHNIDYDFNDDNISSSQAMFENRIASALKFTPHPSTPMNNNLSPAPFLLPSHDSLDAAVACTPDHFSSLWDFLPEGKRVFRKTERAPLTKEIHSFLESRRFYTVASGIVDTGKIKVFAVAQKVGIRCLCEMTFDPRNRDLGLQVKSEDPSLIPFFMKFLKLESLFGNSIL